MNGWMDEWMVGWMDVSIDSWIDGLMNVYSLYKLIS